MPKRITVVLSQGQSNNPQKRTLEETIVAELIAVEGINLLVIPHIYDLHTDSSGMIALQNIGGDFVLLSWLYARAAHWTLDRQNIRGHLGETSLKSPWDQRKRKWEKQTADYRPAADTPRVLDDRPAPSRTIYHLDLRSYEDANVFVDEIKRLATEHDTQVTTLGGEFGEANDAAVPSTPLAPPAAKAEPTIFEGGKSRRWYPVIDFSRCTNCMECVDFCLFGVYGIDQQETILVEQPDKCRKGCPACSRICPENAIIFPQHKTPAIAGDPSIGGEMKIDLSQLFGKPSETDLAASERDQHLKLAGRQPVNSSTRSAPSSNGTQKDELDDLIDELDELDL